MELDPKWYQIIFENIEEKFHRIKVMDTFLAELKLRLARVYRYAIESGLEIVVTSPENMSETDWPQSSPGTHFVR